MSDKRRVQIEPTKTWGEWEDEQQRLRRKRGTGLALIIFVIEMTFAIFDWR